MSSAPFHKAFPFPRNELVSPTKSNHWVSRGIVKCELHLGA